MWKKAFYSFNLFIVTLALSSFILSGPSHAAEFSADMVISTPEGVHKGKFFFNGTNFRQEIDMAGEKQVMIFRQDKNLIWVLMPEAKMYMEVSSQTQVENVPQVDQHEMESLAEKKHLGKETVNGYDCEIYQYIYHDKSMGTNTQWFSKKLNFPIKMEMQSPSGRTTTEYKNISEKSLSNELFEIPAGYRTMGMPGMMPDMKGMMDRMNR
jgi:outer membrane lipoprotein-sorting protein